LIDTSRKPLKTKNLHLKARVLNDPSKTDLVFLNGWTVEVKGNDLILSCRNCFSKHGYAVKLEQNGNGGTFDCPLCGLKYVVKNGLLEEFDGNGV